MRRIAVLLASLLALCATSTAGVAACPSGLLGVTWTVCLESDSGAYKDAGTTLAVNNDTVQQWNDASGNANNATQSTALNRPPFKTSIVNGLPVLRCDGSSSFMLGPNVFPTTQSYTLIVVSVQRGTSTGNLVSGATSHALFYNSTDTVKVSEGGTTQLTSTTPTGVGVVAVDILGVYNSSNTTAAHAEAFNLTVNGNYNTGIADTSVNASDTALQICAFNSTNFGQVDILAVYLASGLLNLTNTNAATSYVNSKYGTTIAKFGTARQHIVFADSMGVGFLGQPPFAMIAPNDQHAFAVNLGSQGAYMLDLKNSSASAVNPLLISAPTLGQSFITILAGGNDLVLGGRTAAQVYADFQTLCSNLHAANSNTLVGIIDMPPRSAGSEAARTTLNGDYDADTCADYHVKTTCNVAMWAAGANTNSLWYANDNLHPNANGHSIIAGCLEAAIAGLSINAPVGSASHASLKQPANDNDLPFQMVAGERRR
jgi:lysophospholipase L1-like esterase